MKSNKIHWSEIAVGILVGGLLVSFIGLLVFSYTVLNVQIPACLTATQPFEKGEVIQRYDTLNHKEKYEVHAVARMWQFEPAEIHVRSGTKVEFYLSSADVTHGFHIVGTAINLMAVPGALNYAAHTFDKAGEYRIICHEFCGVGHHNMMAKIVVSSRQPQAMLSSKNKPVESFVDLDVGKKLFQEKGCAACHSVDGNPGVGPTFKGLFGRTENLETGPSVTVDDSYLRESILSPNVKIVKGFQPVMPHVDITDAEAQSLINYIRSLER